MAVWVFNGAATLPEGPPPFNSEPAVISGQLVVGETLTATPGVWIYEPTSVTGQWYRASSLWGTYSAIPGETGLTYDPTSSDINGHVHYAESATNAGGTTVCASCATMKILATADTTVFNEAPTLVASYLMPGYNGNEFSPESFLRMTAFCLSEDKTEFICSSSELVTPFSVGKCTIPANGGTASPTATMYNLLANDLYLPRYGGFLAYNGRIITTQFSYYPSGAQTYNANWVADTLDDQGAAYARITDGVLPADFFAGNMCLVPAALQAAMGGPAAVGLGSAAIISQRSAGPCMATFDPDDVNGAGDVTAITKLYFDTSKSANGLPWTGVCEKNLIWTLADWPYINGVMENYDTLLFIDRHGIGTYGYGTPTSDPALVGQPVGDGSIYVWDPTGGGKGTVAYPYRTQVLLYKRSTVLGLADPRDAQPYAVYPLAGGFGDSTMRPPIGGYFDADTNKAYVGYNNGSGHMRVEEWQFGAAP